MSCEPLVACIQEVMLPALGEGNYAVTVFNKVSGHVLVWRQIRMRVFSETSARPRPQRIAKAAHIGWLKKAGGGVSSILTWPGRDRDQEGGPTILAARLALRGWLG